MKEKVIITKAQMIERMNKSIVIVAVNKQNNEEYRRQRETDKEIVSRADSIFAKSPKGN